MGNLYKVQNRFLFHSNIKIKIPDGYEEKIFDEFFSVLEEVNRKYEKFKKDIIIFRSCLSCGIWSDKLQKIG